MSDDPIDLSALRKPKKAAACPICGRAPVLDFRPFCSRRCSDVDLNRWLGEVYRVPAEDVPDEEEGR